MKKQLTEPTVRSVSKEADRLLKSANPRAAIMAALLQYYADGMESWFHSIEHGYIAIERLRRTAETCERGDTDATLPKV